MSYQFGHLSTFSRKGNSTNRSVRDVLMEAGRVDGNMPHVAKPLPPTLLVGMSPEAALAFHDERCAAVGRGRGRGQSLRKDAHTLVAGVFSFPFAPEDKDTDEYKRLRDETIAWARSQIEERGGVVLGCVQHEDETYLHVHIYGMYTADPRLNAKRLHPGHIASAAAKAAGENPTTAYKAAMSQWQQDYHSAVTSRHGLTRIGPGRRRLSRAAHMAEVAEAAHQAALVHEREKHQAALTAREAALGDKEAAADEARSEASQVAKEMIAIATGMSAWAAGEMDDEANITRQTPPLRRMQIIELISPAPEAVKHLVRKLGQHAKLLTSHEREGHRATVKIVADQHAADLTKSAVPAPGE
jgi:hypothetical protein